jgi:hypothetical protein
VTGTLGSGGGRNDDAYAPMFFFAEFGKAHIRIRVFC